MRISKKSSIYVIPVKAGIAHKELKMFRVKAPLFRGMTIVSFYSL